MNHTHHSHEIAFEGFAYEAVTVSNSAIGLTKATYDPGQEHQKAIRALITVETANMRYTYDGTTPTSTVGHLVGNGDVVTLNGYGNIKRFKAIRTDSDASIKVTYER